jgi:hypothetical protein
MRTATEQSKALKEDRLYRRGVRAVDKYYKRFGFYPEALMFLAIMGATNVRDSMRMYSRLITEGIIKSSR